MNSAASAARVEAWRRLNQLRLATGSSALFPEPFPLADRRERALASRMVLGVLRNLSLLDACIERGNLFDPRKTPRAILWVLRLAAYEKIFQAQSPDYAIGAQAVALARLAGGARAAGFVNVIVRRLLPALTDSLEALQHDPFWLVLTDFVRWSIPEPIWQALERGYQNQNIQPLMRSLTEDEAPVWLRVNTLRTDRAKLARDLHGEGVDTAIDIAAPDEALRWQGGILPWAALSWKRGELTVQDSGAMLAAHLLNPRPGETVLDLCAAPGGKTGQLWESMNGRGRLVALEIKPKRRAELRQTLHRLYGADHKIVTPDLAPEEYQAPDGFDKVLIDAPCQALGLIRRHPEIRWDGRLKQLPEMQETQRKILRTGARFVVPGGRLLWVTCSPTREENEDIIEDWLRRNRNWRPVNPAPLLKPSWLPVLQINEYCVRTRPDQLASDGFAMMLLEWPKSN